MDPGRSFFFLLSFHLAATLTIILFPSFASPSPSQRRRAVSRDPLKRERKTSSWGVEYRRRVRKMGPRGQPRRAQEYARKGGTRNRQEKEKKVKKNHAHRASRIYSATGTKGGPAGRDMNVDNTTCVLKQQETTRCRRVATCDQRRTRKVHEKRVQA